MQVLITHLTRMQPGYFCAAGIDVSTGKHVRPALGRRLTVDLLHQNGCVFALAAVVDIGKATRDGSPPEIEDYRFRIEDLQLSGFLNGAKFVEALQSALSPSLKSIFGRSLAVDGRGLAVPAGSGKASLGSIESEKVTLRVDQYNKVKLSFTDSDFDPELSVTDIRLYEADQTTPNLAAIQRLTRKVRSSRVIVNVGLSRAFKKPGGDEAKHWLQVNNVHLDDDPLGDWAID